MALEERYAQFYHWMRKIKGYMHVPCLDDIKAWEEWKDKIEAKEGK